MTSVRSFRLTCPEPVAVVSMKRIQQHHPGMLLRSELQLYRWLQRTQKASLTLLTNTSRKLTLVCCECSLTSSCITTETVLRAGRTTEMDAQDTPVPTVLRMQPSVPVVLLVSDRVPVRDMLVNVEMPEAASIVTGQRTSYTTN